MDILYSWTKKRITLDELYKLYNHDDYAGFVSLIRNYENTGRLKPVKSSGTNGKKPALQLAYHVIEKSKENCFAEKYITELKYQLHPSLKSDYYLRNLDKYETDRELILELNHFWRTQLDELQYSLSMNERSFQIWGREKLLKEGKVNHILKHLVNVNIKMPKKSSIRMSNKSNLVCTKNPV